MSKTLMDQAFNEVKIAGKLIDVVFRDGKFDDGRPFKSATMTIRVTQTYNGQEETSEIPLSMIASQVTAQGKPSATYNTIVNKLPQLKTAQANGFEVADRVAVFHGKLRENTFPLRDGRIINGIQFNTNALSSGDNVPDVAAFSTDIFIMDMHPEEDRDGDPTGRLIIKGALVQYGTNLDVLEFVVENPDTINFIERNWNINDTLNVRGFIRYTAKEQPKAASENSWGEDIPEMTTRIVRELVITKGDDNGREEDFAYDMNEIRKGFNVRKAKLEQLQINAQKKAAQAPKTNSSEYPGWE